MSKFWLITILGFLLIGCTGQVPYTAMLVEEVPPEEAVASPDSRFPSARSVCTHRVAR